MVGMEWISSAWDPEWAQLEGAGLGEPSSIAWFPLREDGTVPIWLLNGPAVSRLPTLSGIIPDQGSAFRPADPKKRKKRCSRAYIANAPLSLFLKKMVYERLDTLLPQAPSAEKVLGLPPFSTPMPSAHPLGLPWRVEHTPEDGCVEVSRFSYTPEYYSAFAAVYLDASHLRASESVALLASIPGVGPWKVYCNGMKVGENREFNYVTPRWRGIILTLRNGINWVGIHGEMIGWRESRLTLGMHFILSDPAFVRFARLLRVGIPVPDPDAWAKERSLLERVQVRRFCFPDGKVRLSLPLPGCEGKGEAAGAGAIGTAASKPELDKPGRVPALKACISLPAKEGHGSREENSLPFWEQVFSLMDPKAGEGGVTAGKSRFPAAGAPTELEAPAEPEGITLEIAPSESFTRALKRFPRYLPLELRLGFEHSPLSLRRPVFLPRSDYRSLPYGEYAARKREALETLSDIHGDPMAEMAALALGQKDRFSREALDLSLSFLRERRDCADFYALSLLTALHKFGSTGKVPTEDTANIREVLLEFKYWHDEPGVDAMCWFTENHQIIFFTAGYLAGNLFPQERFRNSGLLGKDLARRSHRRIRNWVLPRLKGGYMEWDSNTYLAMDIYALLALVEFSPSPSLRRMTRTLLDKTFFMIACQSLRGAHGCSHGRCYTEGLKTARVESTSGLQRIGWGMGGFDGETWATVMLALSDRYQVHPLIQAIGADMPNLLETRSCSQGTYTPYRDLRRGSWAVHTLSRRTPWYLLSAALDHRPGASGIQEHLWQLTFSPEAVLFTTLPGNSREHGNARPNYWAGSAELPRVAMEGRCLICRYDTLWSGPGLGFSHAYCPRESFDEVVERGKWLFVRHGQGYGALRGDDTLRWITQGPHAFQELRSEGKGRVWLAVAGCEEEDGDFASFQSRCLSGKVEVEAKRVWWNTGWGRTYEFPEEGPFLVDGKEHPLRIPWHYHNSYTETPLGADSMTLRLGDETLTLDLDP